MLRMADASSAASALEAFDIASRGDRAERLSWLAQFEIGPPAVTGRPEVLDLKEEARVCYINGLYIATLLTAVACVEQMLSEELVTKGRLDFSQLVDAARKAKLVDSGTLDALNKLREFRNAYAHKKDEKGEHFRLPYRMRSEKTHPRSLMEADAQSAIRTLHAVFRATLKPLHPVSRSWT